MLRRISTLYERIAGDVHDRGNYTIGPPPWDEPEMRETRPTRPQELAMRARMRTVAMYKGEVLDSPACFVAVVLHGELWAHVGGPVSDEKSYDVVKRADQAATASVGHDKEDELFSPPVVMSSAAERALAPQGRLPGKVIVSATVLSPMAILMVYDVEPVVKRPGVLDAFAKEQDSLRASLGEIERMRRRVRRISAVNIKLKILLGIRPPLQVRRLWRAAYSEAKMYRIRTQSSVFVEEAMTSLLGHASRLSATQNSLSAEERSMRAVEVTRRAKLDRIVATAKELEHVPMQPGETEEDMVKERDIEKAIALALRMDATHLSAERLEMLRRAVEDCKAERQVRLARQVKNIEEVMLDLRMSAMTKAEEGDIEANISTAIGRGDSTGSVGRGGALVEWGGELQTLQTSSLSGGGRLATLRAADAELAIVKSSEPTPITFRLARTCIDRLQSLYELPLADLREELLELWTDLGIPTYQPDRRALEKKQFDSASLALVREHTVAVSLLRAARRQVLSLADGTGQLVGDDVRAAMRLGAKNTKGSTNIVDDDATIALNALMDRDRHVIRVLLTEAEKGNSMDVMMEKLREHRGLGADALKRLLDVSISSQIEMNHLIIHRAELMARLRECWAVLETPAVDRDQTATLVMDARGAALNAAQEMTIRLEREAKMARRVRDEMLVLLAAKWRLLGTDARVIQRNSQSAFVGSAEEIRKKSFVVYSDLLREERARREAADVALGGAHTASALLFFKDVVAHIESLGGDLLTFWNVLHEFHTNRRIKEANGSLPILAMYSGSGADFEYPATAQLVPLRALATLCSTRVHSPESISAFGLACYAIDGTLTYDGFCRGLKRCEMVEDGWAELDAEEASMSPTMRANVRETVTRAWTRLDRARAVLDGINSVDLAMQRLASFPAPIVVRTLGAIACILRADNAGVIEGLDEELPMKEEEDGTAADKVGRGDSLKRLELERATEKERGLDEVDEELRLEALELRAEWKIVRRMLANPRVVMRLRSLNPSSLPVDVLCELRWRLRTHHEILRTADTFASSIQNISDYELITSGGGDASNRVVEPLAYFAVCLEAAASLDKIWMRKELKKDSVRMKGEMEANPEANPLALPGVVRKMTKTMKLSKTITSEIKATAAVKGSGGGMFGHIFGGKAKVVPTPASPTKASSAGEERQDGDFHPVVPPTSAASSSSPQKVTGDEAPKNKSNLKAGKYAVKGDDDEKGALKKALTMQKRKLKPTSMTVRNLDIGTATLDSDSDDEKGGGGRQQ